MKTENEIIQSFVDYLDEKLIRNGFFKISPRCFLCTSPVDKIFVYIRDDSMLIVNDGENVIDGLEIVRLHLSEVDEDVFNSYLQDILSLF